MSQMEIIRKASLIRLSDYSGNANLYCTTYQAELLDQLCGILQSNSILNQQLAESLLQNSY